jgi:hypothetical protein
MAKAINYGQLTRKAFRGLMAEVLALVAREGLPGKHHFFITFDTTHPGVDMAATLRARYAKEMTIVQQEWIVVPFDAVKTFVDPSVEFGLRFDAHEEAGEGEAADSPERTQAAPAPLKHVEGEVVSLDKFRKH